MSCTGESLDRTSAIIQNSRKPQTDVSRDPEQRETQITLCLEPAMREKSSLNRGQVAEWAQNGARSLTELGTGKKLLGTRTDKEIWEKAGGITHKAWHESKKQRGWTLEPGKDGKLGPARAQNPARRKSQTGSRTEHGTGNNPESSCPGLGTNLGENS